VGNFCESGSIAKRNQAVLGPAEQALLPAGSIAILSLIVQLLDLPTQSIRDELLRLR